MSYIERTKALGLDIPEGTPFDVAIPILLDRIELLEMAIAVNMYRQDSVPAVQDLITECEDRHLDPKGFLKEL